MTRILFIPALLLALGISAWAQPSLSITQPLGPGSVQLDVTGASAGAELYNLVQFTPASPTGSGPIFGLGVAGSDVLLPQILSPLGTAPYHVSADGIGEYSWLTGSVPVGIMVPIDVVTVEFSGGTYVGVSSVVNITLDL